MGTIGAQGAKLSLSRVFSSSDLRPAASSRSVLLTAMTTARPRSTARPRIFASCSATPAAPSHMRTATSQRSIARIAWNTLAPSSSLASLVTFPLRRMPAVSTKTIARPFFSMGMSMASRVVPGCSSTKTRSSPTMRFASDDLPAFGRPTSAIRIGPLGLGAASSISSSSAVSRSMSSVPMRASWRRRATNWLRGLWRLLPLPCAKRTIPRADTGTSSIVETGPVSGPGPETVNASGSKPFRSVNRHASSFVVGSGSSR